MHNIPLFKIHADQADIDAVAEVVKSGANWALGPEIAEFEKAIAAQVGTTYALVFNSGTSALHALMLAYGFRPPDEVIVPSFSFIATANAPLFVGAKPVFAEIEETTFGLDSKDIEKKITKSTKAIMVIHYAGNPCLIEEIKKIADKYGLILIEDAAGSLGAKVGSKNVGTFGDAAAFSFCGPKVIAIGEGGAVVTNNKEIFEKLKLIRSHGRQETADYFSSAEYMDYISLGYNFRMSSMAAALGLSQLKKIDTFIAARRKNAEYLNAALASVQEIVTPMAADNNFPVYQLYTIRVKGGKAQRDSLKDHLNKKGITAKVYFYPIHLTGFYKKTFHCKAGDLPLTENVSDTVLTLPMYPGLSHQEMDYITAEIKNFFKT